MNNSEVNNPSIKLSEANMDNLVARYTSYSEVNTENVVSKYMFYIFDFSELINNYCVPSISIVNSEFVSMRLEILGNDNRILFVYCHYYDDDICIYNVTEYINNSECVIAQFRDVPSTIAYVKSQLYAKESSS